MEQREYNTERGFISSLMQTGDMVSVNDAQINESFFTGDHKNAFKFIKDTYIDTESIPTLRVFNRKFPNYRLEKVGGEVGTEETLAFWCVEIRKKATYNKLVDTIERAGGELGQNDFDKAINIVKSGITFIDSELAETDAILTSENTEDLVNWYAQSEKDGGVSGIPTGVPMLDYLLGGIQEGTLTVLTGNSGIGKSWITLMFASNMQLQDYSAVFGLTEMSEKAMRIRHSALLYSYCEKPISWNAVKGGKLSLVDKKSYTSFLVDSLPRIEPIIFFTALDPMGVQSYMDKHKPDIVFIDSFYLMEDNRGKDGWEQVRNVVRDLKRIAKRTGIPVVINSQIDKNSNKKTGPELSDMMFSQSIIQEADNIVAVYKDEDDFKEKTATLKILKNREGNSGRVKITWNFDEMGFSQYDEDDNIDDGSIELD